MRKILHLMAMLIAIAFPIHVQSQTISVPGLGAAQEFSVLGSSSVINAGTTLVYSDLGTSPGTNVQGFPPGGVVLGNIHKGGAEPAAAQTDAQRVYDALGNLTPTQNLTGQQLGKGFTQTPEAVAGTLLRPGVYHFDGDARLKGQLRFDGQGSSENMFIIQVNGDLIVEDGSVMSVQNGAQPKNVYIRVTGNLIDGDGELKGTGSALKGNIIVQNDITLSEKSTHEGRLWSLGGNVFLNSNTIFLPNILATDLAITKTADKSVVAIGDTVTYTITVRNQGPDDATGVVVTEELPNQIAFLDYTSFVDNVPVQISYTEAGAIGNGHRIIFAVGDLKLGQTATIKVRTKVIGLGADIKNKVTVVSKIPDPDPDDDEDEEPIEVPAKPTDLQVIKTVDKTRANVGDALTYTITVQNNGPITATGVNVRDLLPLGQLAVTGQPVVSAGAYDIASGVWTIGNLTNGQTATLTVNATITATGTIANTAVIRGNQADQQPDNNTSTVVTVVETGAGQGAVADLQITKVVDKTRASIGQTLTYTITARNLGPDAATGVMVTDVLPRAFLTLNADPTVTTGSYHISTGIWTIGNLPVGQTATMTVTGTITANGIIVNTATIIGAERDERPENNTSTAITEVGAGPEVPTEVTDLQVTKTVNKTTATVGEVLAYTVTARNNGPIAATGVLVVDILPLAQVGLGTPVVSKGSYDEATGVWTVGNLAIGETATLTVSGAVISNGAIVNTAVIIGNEADPQPQNNTSTVITNADGTPEPGELADLEVVKTVDKTRASVGDALTYTITARNNGPAAATGVKLEDKLPTSFLNLVGQPVVSSGTYDVSTGIWTIGNLAPRQIVTMTVSATVKATGSIVNTARIGGNQADQQPANNTSTVVTVVGPGTENGGALADLQVTKTVDKARASAGQTLTYTITAHNAGPDKATSVQVKDIFPTEQLTLTGQPVVSVGTYDASTGIWAIGELTAGQTVAMTVSGTITATTGVIVNTAVISGSNNQTDERPENNTATVTTIIGAGDPGQSTATDLQVVKTVDKARASVGQTLTYTITATNNGAKAATGVLVVDVLPTDQVNFTSEPTVSQGAYDPNTSVWTLGDLPVGQTAVMTVTGTITKVGTVVNTAVIRANEADTQPQNNASTVITVVTTPADVIIEKRVEGNAQVTLGDRVTFVLRAMNAGPGVATSVQVKDVLPTGLQFVSADPTTEFDSATGNWAVGNLAAGASNAKELRITALTTQVGTISNIATVENGNEEDPNKDNNTDTAYVCVKPTVPVVADASVCAGSNATFTITPIAGVTNFEVSGLPAGVTRVNGGGNTITLQVATTVAPGTYSITFAAVSSEAECTYNVSSTATLTVGSAPLAVGPITASASTFCSGTAVTFTVNAVPGALNYRWTVPAGWTYQGQANGPFTTTEPVIELVPSTTAGTVSVQAVNDCSPGAATSIAVTPGTTPAVPTLSNNSGPCQGLAFAVVSPEPGVTYNWVAPAGFTITSGQGTAAITLRVDMPGAKGLLTVTASSGQGACASAVASMEIDAAAVENKIEVPTVFSPNGDGVNDVLVIKGLLNFPDNDLYIYNRWGNEVFRARSYRNNWAATGLEEATYFYVLRVRGCNGQEQVLKGYVQVVR